MRRFLIVDDNLALADNLAEIVADAAAGEAVLAKSGAEALGLVAGDRFDALVSDVCMPGMDGLELVRRVRCADPALPALLLTAYAGAPDLRAALCEGLLGILPKPVPIARLLLLLGHARRNGAVLLVGTDTLHGSELAEALRTDGFAPVLASAPAEPASFGTAPIAVVADLRARPCAERGAIVRLARALPALPLLALVDDDVLQPPELPAHEEFAGPAAPARLVAALGLLHQGIPRGAPAAQ